MIISTLYWCTYLVKREANEHESNVIVSVPVHEYSLHQRSWDHQIWVVRCLYLLYLIIDLIKHWDQKSTNIDCRKLNHQRVHAKYLLILLIFILKRIQTLDDIKVNSFNDHTDIPNQTRPKNKISTKLRN